MPRQEIEPKRSYNTTPIKGRRSVADWSAIPDYNRMPDWVLLGVAEVGLLTGLSRTALDARIISGTFPAPGYHGKNRVWRLSEVRDWCLAVTGGAK